MSGHGKSHVDIVLKSKNLSCVSGKKHSNISKQVLKHLHVIFYPATHEFISKSFKISRVARILLCWRDAWGGGTAGAGGSTEHLPGQRDEEAWPEPRHFLPHRERQDHRLSDSLCLR